MLAGFTVLLVFQLVGEVLARALGLPIPGPVVGMVLLFGALRLRRAIPDCLAHSADALLTHLSLLFVPAGVGAMLHAGRLADEWLAIVVALLLSTIGSIAVTALVMRALQKRASPRLPP